MDVDDLAHVALDECLHVRAEPEASIAWSRNHLGMATQQDIDAWRLGSGEWPELQDRRTARHRFGHVPHQRRFL